MKKCRWITYTFCLILIIIHYSFSDTLQFPPGLIIPNYNRIPVGQIESMEGGAFVARSSGIAANWYNPAGLATESFLINAASSGYELINIKLEGFQNSPHSLTFNGTPGFIGIVKKPAFKKLKKRFRLGLSFGQRSSWQPTFDSNVKTSVSDSQNQLSISYKLNFSTSSPAISLAMIVNSRLRLGLGISLPFTALNIYESIGDQILSGDSIKSSLINLRVNGLIVHLVASAGLQYSLSEKMITGILIKTPGLALWNNAKISYESNSSIIDTSVSVVFQDSTATFKYRLPLQCSFGIAYKSDLFQIEIDMNYFNGTKTYSVLESGNEVLRLITFAGSPLKINYLDFPDLSYERSQVFNAAIGGHYKISDLFKVHGGVFTDFSPVNSQNSTIFRKINLYGTTLGLSINFKNIGAGIGFKYSFGRTKSFTIGQEQLSEQITHLRVSSYTLIWALSLGL